MEPERWRFFTDRVMGGVSTGQAAVISEGGAPHLRMTGTVSTANRGGFIQMRTDLTERPPEGAQGVRLVVRGNGARYFVHLRTTASARPWQFHQAGFETGPDWAEVRLPFAAFEARGGLSGAPRPGTLTSLAIAAYGRDHDALVEVRAAGFY